MNYKNICKAVGAIARDVGQQLKDFRAQNALEIEAKGHNDFVTQMDRFSERLLVEELTLLVPEAGFIAEEQTRTDRGEHFNWIIDPIDGTTNFIHSMPPFAISIALMEDDEVVVGVVYELFAEELFSAWKSGGAYLNGRPIHVTRANSVGQALVATGFPYSNFSLIDPYISSLRELMEQAQGVRRIGSAATDLAYVAAGRFDVFYEYDLKPYDVAAGCLLVTEAGGRLSDFRGENNYIFGRQIVASAPELYDDFMAIIKKHF